MTFTDYAEDISLGANTPTQAKFPLNSLEKASGSIGFRMNADETEYICFNKK